MTFLQPFMLWGLPLVLLPVLIHLLNRLRHRSLPWAAMMFLRSASRKSTRYARLRQWLVLLLRMLAVLALVLALSRPLGGGWMGWLAGRAPDTILVLLDRSASMEAFDSGGQRSRRLHALELFARSAQALEPASRLVFLDHVLLDPQSVSPADALPDHPAAAPSDTAADIPALLQTALDWITQNQPGSVELWVASDLQRSNWLPEDSRWAAIVAGLESLPQPMRVRLLALNQESGANLSVTIRSSKVRSSGSQAALEIGLDLRRTETHPATIPLTLTLNGVPSLLEIPMEGTFLRYQHRVPLDTLPRGGWGRISLPADSNPADNTSYFVYETPVLSRSVVLAEDSFVGQVLQLAAAPDATRTNQLSRWIRPDEAHSSDWAECALVLWQGSAPAADQAQALETFVQSGGILMVFPPGQPQAWMEYRWGDCQEAEVENGFVVGTWEEDEGPLARTEEGWSLPLQDLQVRQRQPVVGPGQVLAQFEDGSPLLVRRHLGRGQILVWTTRPHPQWSRLHEGSVLLPVAQRLLEAGAERFSQARLLECGPDAATALSGRGTWTEVASAGSGSPLWRAGVFQSGNQWVAVQRPAREDEPERVSAGEVQTLFGQLPFHLFEEHRSGMATLQSELWRLFLMAMLGLLVAEAVLILPERPASRQSRGAET